MDKGAVGTGKAAPAIGRFQMKKKLKVDKAKHTAVGTEKAAVATNEAPVETTKAASGIGDFEPFKAMVRKQWQEKGYDFGVGLDRVKDEHKENMDEWRKHQESVKYIEYSDSDDEVYDDFFDPYDPEELLEQKRARR